MQEEAEMGIEREAGGPGRLRTAGVRFHQRQMGRPRVSSKDNHKALAVCRGWFRALLSSGGQVGER